MKILVGLFIFLSPGLAPAETSQKSRRDLSLGLGYMISARIKGVKEAYTTKGLHFSHPLYSFNPEWSLLMTEEHGVKFYNAGLSLRFYMNDIFLPEDNILPYWVMGLSYTAYKPVLISSPPAEEYLTQAGAHLGYGFKFYLSSQAALKIDGRMHIEPGRFFVIWSALSWDL